MKKNTSMKRAIILQILLVITGFAIAKTPAYVELEAGGGVVLMPYGNIDNGIVSGGNFDVAVKYTLLFKTRPNIRQSFGINFGAGLSTFQGTKVLDGEYEFPSIDDQGRDYLLNTNIQNWTERQQSYAFNIPINLFYQLKPNRMHSGWFISLGVKLYVPFSATFKVTQGDITTKGWYEQYGGTWIENLPLHGFGMRNDFLPTGKIQTNLFVSGQIQAGVLFRLDKKREMYVAGYIEHGFNNMFVKSSDNPLFISPTQYNGFYSSNLSTSSLPIITGIKIGWRFADVHECNCINR